MVRWLVAGFIVFVALAGVWGAAVFAQTTTQTSSTAQTSSTTGAFDSLSPGNQKIARALFEAQTTGTTTTQQTNGSNGTTTQPLTLDEIAAKKQGGQGWGNIFKDMKAQGLVQDKNLGQAVSRYQRSTHGGTSTTQGGTYSASGRQFSNGSHGQGAKSFDDGTGGGKQAAKYGPSGSSQSGAGRSGGGSSHGGGGRK